MGDMPKVKLNAMGVDAVCEAFASGMMMRELARKMGINIWSMVNWCRDPVRADQIRSARAEGAALWDERAERVLLDVSAKTEEGTDAKVGFYRAQALAQHYRWRASKLAPAEYGDKVAVEHSGRIATPSLDLTKLTDDQLEQLRTIAQAAAPAKGVPSDE